MYRRKIFPLIFVSLLVTALFIPHAQAEAAECINPATDLVYLGAFRPPDEKSSGSKWEGAGGGMTYYPLGDPGGPTDGYPGSLFGVGRGSFANVSEFTIPTPFISPGKDLADLPRAETLQPFTDVTDGRQEGSLTGTNLSDIQYYPKQGSQVTDKLYWTMFEYYLPPPDKVMHGWCELDFSDLQSKGAWGLGNFPAAATSRYLFEIPQDWADAKDPETGEYMHTPAMYLAAGRFRQTQGGSQGPALYAYGPWNDGNPPEDGSYVDAVELLHYGGGAPIDDFGHGDRWSDGAWITAGNKHAVIFTGMRGMRNMKNGLEYYGPPGPRGTGGKGYHAEPHYKCILFYDPQDLAQVAGGGESSEPQPYAVFNVQGLMFNPEEGIYGELGGVGFDRERNLLYVIEKGVREGRFARMPIVHVWRVEDIGGAFDTVVPSPPTNLQEADISSDYVDISWDAAIDNTGVSGYVVYRDFMFIGVTDKLTFRDTVVSPNTAYKYSIVASDAMNNYSSQSIPLTVVTPDAEDLTAPCIQDVQVKGITPTSAVISWMTDEPTTTSLGYNRQWHSEEKITICDQTLTTVHSVTLNGLTPATTYMYITSAVDGFGNGFVLTNSMAKFVTADEPPAENQLPELDPIGAQELNEGEPLELMLGGDDPEGSIKYFSARGLPKGAMFNRRTYTTFDYNNENARFFFQPRFDQAGVYEVTFTLSDGTLSDSETVTITVLDADGSNDMPVLAYIGNKSVDETMPLDFTISATDEDGDSLTYTANDLPEGASFISDTFNWIPGDTQWGIYPVTFTVSDGSLTDSETINITVNNTAGPPNNAPVLDPIEDLFYVVETSLLEFAVTAIDQDGHRLFYIVEDLPKYAIITGSFFRWTPTKSQAGTYNPTFRVTDGDLSSNAEEVTIIVVDKNSLPGDVNRDKKVDILDLAQVAVHFGMEKYPSGGLLNPNWDEAAEEADITRENTSSGKIDILDLVAVAVNFGTEA